MDAVPFGIYVHIPYCRRLCNYCGFVRSVLNDPIPEAFLNAICEEVSAFEGPSEAQSIFLGGGTPSLLGPGDLGYIFEALYARFSFTDPEITMEVNADDVTSAQIMFWKEFGVNRISLGVQSFNDDTLRYLGRRHDAAGAMKAAAQVAANFENWSMDLIYGADTLADWEKTLRYLVSLRPPHVSTYALTYVPNTPIGDSETHIDEDVLLQLYQHAESLLSGYDHYEISNFARTGFQCRHNLLYWHNEQYAGFGPGAFSMIDTVRSANPSDTERYIAAPGVRAEEIPLSIQEQQVETLIQHFRLRDGIAERYYAGRFGEPVETGFEIPLRSLMERGLLSKQSGRIFPTAQGFYLNDEIGLALVDA